MFRESLARALESEPDFTIAGQCASSAQAVPLLKRGVTMVLLDVDLGTGRALEFVETARKTGYSGADPRRDRRHQRAGSGID